MDPPTVPKDRQDGVLTTEGKVHDSVRDETSNTLEKFDVY